jgi:cytidylate kinase
MHPPKTIAIDGPAASGKSTLGKSLADKLGYLFFDTGIMYRAVTWMSINLGVPLEDERAVTALAETCEIDILPPSKEDGRNCDILIDGKDVTWEIRRPEVDANVSLVSSYPGVRKALTAQQRRIGLRGEVVMVGRDIGTVVLPEAQLKIYLDASPEVRARRRYKEILARGGSPEYEKILTAVQARDSFDSTRDIAPLHPAEDAVILNSDNLDASQVESFVLELVRSRSS